MHSNVPIDLLALADMDYVLSRMNHVYVPKLVVLESVSVNFVANHLVDYELVAYHAQHRDNPHYSRLHDVVLEAHD